MIRTQQSMFKQVQQNADDIKAIVEQLVTTNNRYAKMSWHRKLGFDFESLLKRIEYEDQ